MITIYTDGSFNVQRNIGGWAAIVLENGEEFEYSGNSNANEGFSHSGKNEPTAQRMEIIAVLEGLLTLHQPSEVEVISDSKYVVETMSKGWLENWITENNTEKKHLDLWRVIYTLSKIHKLKFTWVKGHSGNHYNERCDKLAQMETKSQMNLIDLAKEKNTFNQNSEIDEINQFVNITAPFSEEISDESYSDNDNLVISEKKKKKSNGKKKRSKSNKDNYYAVAKGRNIGIFKTWSECSKSVNRYKGSIFKRFDTEEEARGFMNKHK